jgi:hypothetical protein
MGSMLKGGSVLSGEVIKDAQAPQAMMTTGA